jgi:hypothetical protein
VLSERYGADMPNSIPITLVLLVAPASSLSPSTVARVDVDSGPTSTSVLARNNDDEVVVEVVAWLDADQRQRLDVVWPDGLYLSVRSIGDDVELTTDDAAEVETRTAELDDVLHQLESKGWGMCALHVVGTALHCGTGSVVGCALGALGVACECYPLIVDDLEGKECFE